GGPEHGPARFFPPPQVADHPTQRLPESVPTEMFATLTYMSVNTARGEVRCTIAGHEPPVVRGADGSIATPTFATGPALGLIPNAAFRENSFHLGDRDILLLYTDGLTTAHRPDGSRTGLEPAIALLRAFTGGDLEPLVQAMLATAVPPGGEPEDDVAILLVQRQRAAGSR